MKNFYVQAANGSKHKTPDLWNCMRNEGRVLVNIATGLAGMGYNVDIYDIHKNLEPQIITSNLRITESIKEHYDYAIGFTNLGYLQSSVNSDKYFIMEYQPHSAGDVFNAFSKDNKVLCCPYKPRIKMIEEATGIQTVFFPALYPLYYYNDSFLSFKQPDFKKRELTVFGQVRLFDEDNNAICNDFVYLNKVLNLLSKQTNSYIVFNLLTNQGGASNKRLFDFNGKVNPIIGPIDYKQIYNYIEKCDLGIALSDTGTTSNSQFDYIGLGKPSLYMITDSKKGRDDKSLYPSPLYYVGNNLLSVDMTDKEIGLVIENFIEDTESYFNSFRDTVVDYNFPIWRHRISKILECK